MPAHPQTTPPAPPAIHLIYARARNGTIGRDGKMPWHLPEDLAHFKRTTLGAPVIMGRKTWDSLPPQHRPLPGRTNIVITRQPHWQAPGAHTAHSLEQAIALCPDAATIWVLGGAQIYAQALPLAQQIVVTEIDADFTGDAHAPTLDTHWHETTRQSHTSASGLPYSFVTYTRQPS